MHAAREAHPDKGGDKQMFQDINNAYEKIMLQRKGCPPPLSYALLRHQVLSLGRAHRHDHPRRGRLLRTHDAV